MKICRIILLSAVFFLFACGASSTDIGEEIVKPDAIIRKGSAKVYRRSEIESKTDQAQKPADGDASRSLTSAERAKRLSGLVTSIKGIDEATVVVAGNTAIVGLKPVGHLDDLMLLKLKKEIDNVIKSDDDGIKNVAITAKPELVSRVSKMLSAETSSSNIEEDIPAVQMKFPDL